MKRNCQRVENLTGFTLVEVLVVLAIMSIIISLTLASLNSIRPKNRDMKRISDVGHLQEALEMYRGENYVYPASTAVVAGQPLVGPNGVTYMNVIPTSPGHLDGSCATDSYTYTIQNSGLSYTIQYCLGGTAQHLSAGNLQAVPGQLGVPVAAASSLPTYYPTSGLLAYWPMNGNSNDTYGSYNGTDHSMSYVTDGLSQAASFGGSSYIDYGDVLDMGTNSQTINFWMKTNTSPSTYTGIICKSKYASEVGRYWIDAGGNAPGYLEAGCANAPVDTHITKLYPYYDNTWHMVTGLWNRTGNMSLYVDNEYFTGTSISAFSAANWQTADKLLFGVYNDTNGTSPKAGSYFNGRLDEVVFYNRALSTSEIGTIFNGQKSTYFTSPTGTIANWNFEGDVTDSVGSYNGTASNLSYVATGTNQTASFNGSSSMVTIARTADLEPTNAVTVSTWVKLNSLTCSTCAGGMTGAYLLFKKNAFAQYFEGYTLFIFGSKFGFGISTGNSGSSQSTYALANASTGTWYHVVGTFSRPTMKIYINGVYQSTASHDYNISYDTGVGMFLGRTNNAGFDGLLNGYLDDTKIYTRALSATEVSNLYNLTKGNY
jgi:prepilin-type N-terminal cleavage/methylation domain-containing protein